MIATIDIKVNAAHPNIPLAPLYAFEGSPSNVRILNVPQRVGKWAIDAVSVTIAMPDNSSTTVPAVAVCGYWVATLPSCDETGYCASGLQITASGTDENGAAVSGYCLGAGDVTILSRDATVVSNGTRYYLHYVAEQPEHPNPGDMCYISGVLKWYDGTAWQTFADGGASIDVVPPSTDPADAGKAADAKATGDALAEKRDKDDLALYKKVGVGETWTLVATQSGYEGITTTVTGVFSGDEPAHWEFNLDGEGVAGSSEAVNADSCEVQWTGSEDVGLSGIARRPFAYQPVTGDALAKTSQLPTTPADIGAATAAQGAKADTAVQPSALGAAVRYDLGAAQEIDSEAVETDPITSLDYGFATMADRTGNYVIITAAIDELRIEFPDIVSGKIRDFGLRVVVDASDSATDIAAPALVISVPMENPVTLENPDGTMPTIEGAAAGETSATLLYFSEDAPGVFVCKGEAMKEVE